MIIENVKGDKNKEVISEHDKGTYMMKYNEVEIRR